MDAKKLGITSALLASACCVGPILLVLLGLGGIGLAGFLGKYHWDFQGGAVIALCAGWWVFLRERRKLHGLAARMKGERPTMITLSVASGVVALFVAMSAYTSLAASLAQRPEPPPSPAPMNEATIRLPVKGMTCVTCELTVNSALRKLDGVREAKASASQGTATVEYDPATVTPQQMIEAINGTGYAAELPGQ